MLRESYFLPDRASEIVLPAGQSTSYRELKKTFKTNPKYRQSYKRIDSIAIISDVHGYYDNYLKQLLSNGIIDKDLNWKFGKGHFVFLGDGFDRGDEVTEILWHLFKLEKQAARAGGAVHLLLGNHEQMVLYGDLRYIHEKYRKVEAITGTGYSNLYSGASLLGMWLRLKPVMITINDILFVHAGVSPQLIQKGLKIKYVNQLFAERITGREVDFPTGNEELDLLSGNGGPLWYRGYFNDTTLTVNQVDSILDFYDVHRIIVGHTPHKDITILFDNKVTGIDAGMGYGQPGYMIIYKEGRFYKGSLPGVRTGLFEQSE
ncbi:MAG: metallophosphoesterase [Bacteroidales bacterium]|nr:metallophosphoesterase [Bacteroidales bacterium]MDT8373339.1 metallophosphoesterase [Bacteroidales bacterium]